MAELFSLAVRWSGIILLDEADVYMQDRALNTLQTNQLVSSELFLGFQLEILLPTKFSFQHFFAF